MADDELIEILKEFNKNRVEQLPEGAKKLFYAIMKIADERDKYKKMYEAEKDLVVADELKIIELENKIRKIRG